jgi:signal transduction histidine kinase/FixJ family two-component response regulator
MTEKILLVDDEEDIRLVLEMALADRGYEVLSAENGRAGLELFENHRPPIVVTDIKMPDIDGVDLLRRIKNTDPDAEVIMITGHGDMNVAIESFQSEATDFITKPISVEALDKSLEKAHRRIAARESLRNYTRKLEDMVHEKSRKVAGLEKLLQTGAAGPSGAVDQFRALFEDLPLYVAMIAPDLALTALNSKFRDEIADPDGDKCHRVLKQEERPCDECPIQETLTDGQPAQWETEIVMADGGRREMLVWTAPIRDQQGSPAQALAMYTDLTRVVDAQDHLSALGLLLGSITHTIKGMLTNLDGGMYLLDSGLKRNRPGQVEEGLELVKQMVGRIRSTVLDVLLFSKERDLEFQEVDAAEFTRSTAQPYRAKADEWGLDFRSHCPDDAGRFEVDSEFLKTALSNILDNAFEACQNDEARSDHRIDLTVRPRDDEVIFEIEDNGPGMDETTLGQLFELFYSTKGSKGTGLGSYIARRTVERHGGRIEVDSAPGAGSRFTVAVPRLRSEAGDKTEKES